MRIHVISNTKFLKKINSLNLIVQKQKCIKKSPLYKCVERQLFVTAINHVIHDYDVFFSYTIVYATYCD